MSRLIQPISIPHVDTVEELRRALEVTLNRVVMQANKGGNVDHTDADGKRIRNVANAELAGDAVNLTTLNRGLLKVKQEIQSVLGVEAGEIDILYGLHSARQPAGAHKRGTLYYETDRTTLYQVQDTAGANAWKYISGVMRETLANKPTDLGTNDVGFQFYATDYHHTWRWSGSAWDWAPGDDKSDYIQGWFGDPGTGWSIATGTATHTYAKSDLTTATRVLGGLTDAFLKFGNAAGTTTGAAVAPTIVLPSNTGTATSGISVTIDVNNGTVQVASGTGADVAGDGHTHPGTATLTHAHTMGTATASADGEPKSFTLVPYYRK